MKLLTTICCLLLSYCVQAQVCTAAGQNPATAFPVCGTSTFKQTSVPLCGGRTVASPCKQDGVTDLNPFWYKFTCFESGTLGFVITPANLNDDYDWELYDVTGKDPNDVYSNQALVVSSNWSGESGETGASPAGNQRFVCGGYGKPLYSVMPQLIKGHNYLLLISHFTRTQSGYSLAFKGGSAIITDSQLPALKSVEATCGGDVLRVQLNKNIKCSSIATDGSDFYITPAGTSVAQTSGINCSVKFDTDSLEIKLSQNLAPGTYELKVKKGSDGNTLLDYCDNALPETESMSFTVLPRQPASLDSLGTLNCAPRQLKIYFSKPVLCSSITASGSEFSINGTYPVAVSSVASGNGTTREVTLQLSEALKQEGAFTINLQNGTDGNTIVDECGAQMLPGVGLSFVVKDTVSAYFQYNVLYGCTKDSINVTHDGRNGVNSWAWNLDDGQLANTPSALGIYTLFKPKNISLVVSNGFCSDTASVVVNLDNFLQSAFTVFEDNCPLEPVAFTSSAVGKIVQHHWQFGDGGTASEANPAYTYAQPPQQQQYNVQYTVTNSYGCTSTSTKPVIIYSSCYLAVPTAFTPNNDGKNDLLNPLNAIKAENLTFRVYNRWGQLLFTTRNWKMGWNGRVNGKEQASGTYIWHLQYRNRDTGKMVEQKGTAVLIR